jgi:type IV secretory pathway TrbL component
MTLEEQVATFRNIVKETKDDRAKLEEELAKLKEWTANPSLIPASERGVEATSESVSDDSAEEQTSKKSKKAKKEKKAKKKAKKGKKK